MKQSDEAQGDSFSSPQNLNFGDSPQAAQFLEEAIRSLEAIGGLMEKVQRIASQSGANDAAMLEQLKQAASPGPEQKILDAVLELAAMLRSEDIAAGTAVTEIPQQGAGKSAGRFRDLI
ncbi:hypothetical protein [Noviherbaspirillum pedocola]|uniref:Uncharacterized protein n=1 Tax=Noviherbaspirillum pedocola TaxID=2801341 RepID=A0A934W4W4_9BURK|nr:hypothetical protein [Noviherbaspirillum pedocola]MBK4733255.1 hypothetical protein [Noviherbaspirillum pedocola]